MAFDPYRAQGVDIRDFLSDDGKIFFQTCIGGGQRIGQAWMNSVDYDTYMILSGSAFDPFYRDTANDVALALVWLTNL